MDFSQKDLEISCRYIFKTNNQAESGKTQKLLETILEITIERISEDEATQLEAQI